MYILSDATGRFPDYPEEDQGGSAAIFKEKTPEELERELKEKVSQRCHCQLLKQLCDYNILQILFTGTINLPLGISGDITKFASHFVVDDDQLFGFTMIR